MTVKKGAAPETRDLLVNQGHKQLIITIPANAKVTFAPVNPGSDRGYGHSGYCLRIYTTANNQLAVFTDVRDFRDLSLGVKERVTKTDSKRKKVVGPDGIEDESLYVETNEWKTVEV